MRRSFRLLLAVVLASCPAGIAWGQQVPPYGPVPPPRVEVVPPPPAARYIWQPGHWHWNGYRYVWIAGRYVIRQPHYAQYVPGHWALRGPNWVWIPAHWQ